MLIGMAMLSTGLPAWVNHCRNLVFPPACIFCHEAVGAGEHACSDCTASIRTWPRHHCASCGSLMPEHLAPGPCGRCLKRTPPQTATQSLYLYRDGPVRSAVLDWKLQGRDAGMLWLLDAASARLNELFGPDSLLLPVPMPLSRMRRAGRHHAADLCRHIGEHTGAAFDWRILRRSGTQARQSSLDGAARRKNLRKAFVVDRDYMQQSGLTPAGLGTRQLWVVDDIMTTGATMHFACRALQRAGLGCRAFSLSRLAGRD